MDVSLRNSEIELDPWDPVRLVIFPEMDASVDVPEITDACWEILQRSPSDVMCSSSRMVVKRNGAEQPAVLACTLLAYDPRFELGPTLRGFPKAVSLNHPHCAQFCVLGGAACSRSWAPPGARSQSRFTDRRQKGAARQAVEILEPIDVPDRRLLGPRGAGRESRLRVSAMTASVPHGIF